MRRVTTMAVAASAAFALILCTSAQGNLLVNGGFEAGGASPCNSGWQWTSPSFPPSTCKYDGTTHMPAPAVREGLHRASSDINTGGPGESHIYQVVSVTPGLQIRLTGWIWGGTTGPTYTYFVRIHDGANLSTPVLVAFESTVQYQWHQIDLTGVPTGAQITVEWGFVGPALNWGIVAAHADAFDLTQASPICTGEPTISAVSQNFGISGSAQTGLQVTGTNFDATCQVILRASGLPDIQATNEAVSGDGTTITFDASLVAAPMGPRNIVVTKANCNDATLNNAYTVVLPTLTNGSFESPTEPASCPNPPAPRGAPDNWLQAGVSTGTNHLKRDSDQYPPTCPRPDGDHYASMEIPTSVSFGSWYVYQYVAVTPGEEITVSGQFAGGGRTTVELRVYDGDENGLTLGSRTIERRIGCPGHVYEEWVPGSVTVTPTQGFITVMWFMNARLGGLGIPHASHADNFVLTAGPAPAEICGNGIDDDGDRSTDCLDSDCDAEPACTDEPVEVCGDGLDNDGDLDIDCDDADCSDVCIEICNNLIDDDFDCEVDEGCTEICDNEFDDNENGLVDCADPECAASPICAEDCENGIDDNDNGLIDCYDPVCDNVAPACTCNDPASDIDGDLDVDMVDFAAWQQCYTATATFAPDCRCFDHDRDGDVDEPDMLKLINCAMGPGIPADPACDD